MLKSIKIKNLAVIEYLEIEFSDGLNLFTGETGAGKSIIIDALGLLLGSRTDSDMIRTGTDQMSVEGLFIVPTERTDIAEYLKAAGMEFENQLIIKREMKKDGRSRGLLNGSFVTSKFLRELGAFIVEIHGQNQQQSLLDRNTHLSVLDRYAGLVDEAESLFNIYTRMESVRKQLNAIRQDEKLKAQKIDILQFQIKELEEAALEPGEEERLNQDKQILSNAEFLFRNSSEAYNLINGDETNVLSMLESMKKNLARISDINPAFQGDFESIESFIYNLQDTGYKLQDFSEKAAPDANRLAEVENRLGLMKRLQKKYGSTINEMLEFLGNAKQELQDLNTSEEKEEQLEAELKTLQKKYIIEALQLREKRTEAGEKLKADVERQLIALAMDKTQFTVKRFPVENDYIIEIDGYEYSPGPYGLDEAEFYFAPNIGEDLRPLAKIASGGELSRIMLALESSFKEKNSGKTLIFDEVDTGIGGRVAEIVGKKLRLLAFNNQIICITHLPQVAAYADAHYYIKKDIRLNRTFTIVEKLSHDARIQEIARMLGGLNITETTLQQAREFLKKP